MKQHRRELLDFLLPRSSRGETDGKQYSVMHHTRAVRTVPAALAAVGASIHRNGNAHAGGAAR